MNAAAVRLDDDSRDELARLSKRDDPFCVFSEPPDGVDAQLREALSGRHDFIRDKLVERLRCKGVMPWMTPIYGALLQSLGIDPLAIAVLGVDDMLGSFDLLDGTEDPEFDGEDALVRITGLALDGSHVRLAPGAYWRMNGTAVVYAPATAMTRIEEGYPLSRVVSHPVLDAFPLKVVGVDQLSEAWTITTDADTGAPLDLNGVLALRPNAKIR